MPLYPLTFHPRFKERIWGGRRLEMLYGKPLPPDVPIGESWEISDRPGDESVIANGPLAGRTLRWLMATHGDAVLGGAPPAQGGTFPLLCKILDARERLSLQVHPPAASAAALGGDPKTEMWYIADADPGAELFVGLRAGVTREMFEARVRDGGVADLFHRIPVQRGDTMFLPSGRVHAIGAGLVIFEIQQNSDTTYRVFDWNRTERDGRPRELHVPQSLASIDFDDVEPALVANDWTHRQGVAWRRLVEHDLFSVDVMHAEAPAADLVLPAAAEASAARAASACRVVATVAGRAQVSGGGEVLDLPAGQFALIPAAVADARLAVETGGTVLVVEVGS